MNYDQQIISVQLPNGQSKQLPQGSSGADLAASISLSLSKAAIAVSIDDKIHDLDTILHDQANVKIITPNTKEGLEILRHDTAHVLAQAIKTLYPHAKIAIGPVIDNGFYYDVDCSDKISENDLQSLEKTMHSIIKQNSAFKRHVLTKGEAIDKFQEMNEAYKIEIIKSLPDNEEISIYSQGNFEDLCSGPHGPSTGYLKAFKLLKVAGAYWRGDSSQPMLQRIYGTAWATTKELDEYLAMMKEAEKRDHRKLGREMNLFHFQQEAPGSAFWHHKGKQIFNTLIEYLRQKQNDANYSEIATPEIMDKSMWEASGHWDKFQENMLIAHTNEDKTYVVKPMSCPGALQVLKDEGPQSYKDLPIKLAEFGKVYRQEASGALYGLMRARSFTQDDAHIFCTMDQLQTEIESVCKFMLDVYGDFNFHTVDIKFADRPKQRIGDDAAWDLSESALVSAMKSLNINFELNSGEGAFYGPKIELHLKDAIGRTWQLGTVQVDLNMPQRLGVTYIDSDGQKQFPVMIHRAIFGSMERFMAILLENYAGRLPLWLAPTQIAVLSINERNANYAQQVNDALRNAKLRTIIDINRDTIQYKIRKHTLSKVSILVIVGDEEEKNHTLSIRWHDAAQANMTTNTLSLEALLNEIADTISTKAL